MMPRPFSTDVPTRVPRRRMGTLKARLSTHLYQVDFGHGSEWAHYAGTDLLDLGSERSCVWDPVAGHWWIRPLGVAPDVVGLQILFGASSELTLTGLTRYHAIEGTGVPWEDGASDRLNLFAEAGTLGKWRMELSTAPGAGKSYTFTVFKNAVATAMTITIADADTVGEDVSNTVTVAADDRLTIQSVPSGTPTAAYARWASEFTPTTATRAVWSTPSDGNTSLHTTAVRYNTIGVPSDSWHATEDQRAVLWGVGASIASLFVRLSAAPGAGTSYAFTIMKNGVAEATSTVTIADAATSGNVTGLSIAVAAGDLLSLRCTPTNTPVNPSCYYGISYEPTTSQVFNVSGVSVSESSGFHHPTSAPSTLPSATESERTAMAGAGVGSASWSANGLRVELDTGPGAGEWRRFTVYKNGSPTGLTVQLSEFDTSVVGGTTVLFEPGDTFSMSMSRSSATANTDRARWSFRKDPV